MPGTKRTPIHRINRGLSWSARMEFELGFKGENFSTWDEYRAGWEHYRHILMAQLEWGFRPAAWWDFDAPIRRPRDQDRRGPGLRAARKRRHAPLARTGAADRVGYSVNSACRKA